MKLTRKHIGQLFNVAGADGSWVYQLADVKKGWLLFYDFRGSYYKERTGEHHDWQPFTPEKWWSNGQLAYGWRTAKDK